MSLFEKAAASDLVEHRLFIICSASIALLLFVIYKQPFPYNFVFTLPAFFLLYAEFFSWLPTSFCKITIRNSLIFIFVLAGIVFPFYISLHASLVFDGLSTNHDSLAAALTDNQSDYVGGIPFLFKRATH